MNRLSRYAAAALVVSLMASPAAYAAISSTGFSPSSGWHETSVLSASVPDMDIRLLCHEQARHGWPCGDQNVLAGGVGTGVENL